MAIASAFSSFDPDETPAHKLNRELRSQLAHVLDAHARGLKVYESLRNLDDVIGAQYGNRVIYELVQNAHDAHAAGSQGEIALTLRIRSDCDGDLFVANRGVGFSWENVQAIKNLATSNKEIGEGIGNKGLGFRSVEALTDDVQIFSQPTAEAAPEFAGFCFRFASEREIETAMAREGASKNVAAAAAATVPRYLAAVPILEQPPEITAFANEGYATVIRLPLTTPAHVTLAEEQINTLTAGEEPLLLFLDRIGAVRITIETNEGHRSHTLRRKQNELGVVDGCSLYRVDVGDRREFLVVRSVVAKERVLKAVSESIASAPPLARWLRWKGDALVSVAVPWNGQLIEDPTLYNFLPMGQGASAPIHGYIDAPFFTDIDRRGVNLSLPLNQTLLEAAAETCALIATAVGRGELRWMRRSALVDLIAWETSYASILIRAFKRAGSNLREAPIWPVLPLDKPRCGALNVIVRWPDIRLSIFKPRRVAALTGAAILPPDLGSQRLDRIEQLVSAVLYRNLRPVAGQIAEWAQSLAADMKQKAKRGWSDWSDLYEDIYALFDHLRESLDCLGEHRIFLDRNERLQSLVSNGTPAPIYYRDDSAAARRRRDPLPPPALFRRLRFLHPRIALSGETARAFERAKLLTRYDEIEALAGVPAALKTNSASERKSEALNWAFDVWRRSGAAQVEPVLKTVDLPVPTFSGWTLARNAAFSAKWTRTGSLLEAFLVDASTKSPDCDQLRARLLMPYDEWGLEDHAVNEWHQFLLALGVEDGLKPIAIDVERAGTPSTHWHPLLRYGNDHLGFDVDWRAAVKEIRLNYPNTNYQVDGQIWRLPGQLEYDSLDNSTRELFSQLVLEYLRTHGERHFTFDVGRFDRHHSQNDSRMIPTPLATFVKARPWLAVSSDGRPAFARPSECWGTRSRRSAPPRFVNRLPSLISEDVATNERLAKIFFGPKIGVRDWSDPKLAVERLIALSAVVNRLSTDERPQFRRQYEDCWRTIVAEKMQLPPNIVLVVQRRTNVETLCGNPEAPCDLIVTQDPRGFDARILLETGRAVLDVGDADLDVAVMLLNNTQSFAAVRGDDLKVELSVDEVPFVPRADDPLLASEGLTWLGEAIVLAHEINSRTIERSAQSSIIERRVRLIRIRRCRSFAIMLDGQPLGAPENALCYAYRDERHPTLITTAAGRLTWRWLGECARQISELVDARLRAPEAMLLHLALGRSDDEPVLRPTDDEFAHALNTDVAEVREQLAALRNDTERLVQLLAPVIAYYGGVPLAKNLQHAFEREGGRFDLTAWLTQNMFSRLIDGKDLQRAAREATDIMDLRRILDLDLARLNSCLNGLGITPLTFESDLRRMFSAYVDAFKGEIIDKLRAQYYAHYLNGVPLDEYISKKNLEFLTMDPEWISNRDTLDRTTVKSYIDKVLSELYPRLPAVAPPPLSSVLDKNRRTAQAAAKAAAAVVGAWCGKHETSLPSVWAPDNLQELIRALENAGLFDFDLVAENQLPDLCVRAGCWPYTMPASLDLAELKLSEQDLVRESRRQMEAMEERARIARTVIFAGEALDVSDPSFPWRVRDIAEEVAGEAWRERSGRIALNVLEDSTSRTRQKREKVVARKARSRVSDAQREAMGLVSEWMAFQYLRDRYTDEFNEECWRSPYRSCYFGGFEGDDALGYDFRLLTPSAEWFYEVKSTLEDACEFELTANEIAVASAAASDGRRRYRILYVPYVFDPLRSRVLELPNPMGRRTHTNFVTVGHGSVRFRFSPK